MTALVRHIRRLAFRLWLWWQYSFKMRAGKATWFSRRLPWRLWCVLCASDARSAIAEIARRSGRPLQFLQIGSNDGVLNDPLHETVRTHGWSGVLVEPLPPLFEKLQANYEGVANVRFANVAIGENGTVTMHTVIPRPGDPDWVGQIASLDRDVLRSHAYALADLDQRIVPVNVDSISIPTLVERYGLVAIDVLHIDAEGYDQEIIRQIDLQAGWAPEYVIFEAKHLSREAAAEVRARLRGVGYHFANLWPDRLAYRRTPDGA